MAGKVPPKKDAKAGKKPMPADAKAGKKAVPPNPPTKGGKEDMKAKMDRLRAMKGK
jgi:hypothetical protein